MDGSDLPEDGVPQQVAPITAHARRLTRLWPDMPKDGRQRALLALASLSGILHHVGSGALRIKTATPAQGLLALETPQRPGLALWLTPIARPLLLVRYAAGLVEAHYDPERGFWKAHRPPTRTADGGLKLQRARLHDLLKPS